MKARVGDRIRIIHDSHYCQYVDKVFKITHINKDEYYCVDDGDVELVWFEYEFTILSRRKKLDRILK